MWVTTDGVRLGEGLDRVKSEAKVKFRECVRGWTRVRVHGLARYVISCTRDFRRPSVETWRAREMEVEGLKKPKLCERAVPRTMLWDCSLSE